MAIDQIRPIFATGVESQRAARGKALSDPIDKLAIGKPLIAQPATMNDRYCTYHLRL